MLRMIKGMSFIVGVVLVLVLGFSYGTFIYTSDSYRATEMLVSNLTYGIDITSSDATVSGKTVNVSSGTTAVVYLKVTSLNKVDTKYGVDYKTTKGTGTVKYASNTGWLPTGKINENNVGTYEKVIKVVISATTDVTVDFTVTGGFTNNELTEVASGYTRITEKAENVISYNATLINVVEKETTNNIYGGESTNNYAQYPINEDNTKNIWRILGTYNGIGTKIISNQVSTTTKDTLSTDLNSFYNTLEKQDTYILDTDKFNCTNTSCTSSNYSKVGLISTGEYEMLGGINSYLASSESYFALDNGTIKNITSGGIEETSTSSGLRPAVYLQDYVTVTGSGTVSDPFKLKMPEYAVVLNVVNGTATLPSKMITRGENATYEITPNTGYKLVLSSNTCSNGTLEGNVFTITNVTSAQTCTITLTPESYTLTLDPNGGSVSTTSKTVTYDSTYGDLPTPTRTGYTFNGWYTASSGGTKIESTTQVKTAGNHTLYAHWTINTYIVAFNPNRGSVSTTSKNITYGNAYGTLPTPTREGYRFDGWYNVFYSNTSFELTSGTDNYYWGTLAASVIPGQVFTVKIAKAEVTSGSATKFTTVIYDATQDKVLSTVTTSFGSNVEFTIKCPDTAVSGNTIKLLIYSGERGSTANVSTKYSNINVYSTNIASPTKYTVTSIMNSDFNHTLMAYWIINDYVLTIDPNGGYRANDNVSSVVTYTYNYGSTDTLVERKRDGYTLTGYTLFNTATGSTTDIGGATFTLNSDKTVSFKQGSVAVTLKAIWTPNKYTLTLTKGTGVGTIYYKINGASSYSSATSTQNLSVSYGTTYYYYGVASTGYTMSSCTASSPCSGTMGTSAVSKTLSATINTYKVTLNVVNGTGSTSKTLNYNTTATFTGISPNSGYSSSSPTISCTGGTLSGTTLTVKNVTSTRTCTVTFNKLSLTEVLLADKTTRPGERSDFSTALTTTNTNTLYTATEDGTSVYYFAGNATDNWVKFGGFYWRIIRTNKDGGVRLLYHGDSTTATDAYIGKSAFNSASKDPMYIGYMYGTSGSLANNRGNSNDSTIKGVIDTWYANNLNANYGKYISTTAVYCNDRGNSYGTTIYFPAYSRLNTSPSPIYDCANTKDAFSGSNGEAKLTYPISLMTADEIVFAGNGKAWYYYNSANSTSVKSNKWFTLSPRAFKNQSSGYSVVVYYVGYTNPYGELQYDNAITTSMAVRPVTSLKACVKWKSGDGSADSPYEIEETTSGC